MRLVVGLGNPGRRYAHTRHNIGVRVVERFGLDHGIALDEARYSGRYGRGSVSIAANQPAEVALLAPDTYMNRSGGAVAEALRGLGIASIAEDLIVVLDDADLPFGRIRIRPSGSSGGHKGLASVIDSVGGGDFPRLRFGIGRPEGTEATTGIGSTARNVARNTVDWVLDRFSDVEERTLEHRVPSAAEAVTAILCNGMPSAMNRYNAAPESEALP